MKDQKEEIPKRFRIPDGLWEKIQRLLPLQQAKPQGGCPRNNGRRMMEAIVYVLKTGTKRCIVTDGQGVPLAITVAGANRHDMKMAEATIKNIVIKRPKPTREKPLRRLLIRREKKAENTWLSLNWLVPLSLFVLLWFSDRLLWQDVQRGERLP